MNENEKYDIIDLIKNYLKKNLIIEINKERDWDSYQDDHGNPTFDLKVVLYLEDEMINSSSIRITQ